MWRSSLFRLTRKVAAPGEARSFKVNRGRQIEPTEVDHVGMGGFEPQLGRAFLFTVGSSCVFYTGAAIWSYENHGRIGQQFKLQVKQLWPPEVVRSTQKTGSVRQQINSWWNRQTAGHRVFYGIVAINGAVLGLWRVPRLLPFMAKWFSHSPASRSMAPMLLSTFSHHSPLHFACNMFVLYSFSNAAVALMGQEQFVATYLTAGVFSSFTSYAYKVAIARSIPSLGASGALLGVIGIVCTALPQSQLSIIFLPMFTFSAGSAIKAIMAFDTVGMLIKWRLLDHAAHLGGALFGVGYVYYGHKIYHEYRDGVVRTWHRVRSRSRGD